MENKKLRICYLGDARSPHLLPWTKSFSKFGHDIHVISPHYAELSGAKVYATKTRYNKFINLFLTYRKIRKLIKKINPDIIHIHFLNAFAFLGILSGFCPVVSSVWGSDIALFGERNPITNSVFKYILKKSDLIQVFDKATANFFVKRYNLNSKKIYVLLWGVNPSVFKPIKKRKKIHVLYLRKTSKKYSINTYIEAINLVKKEFPKVISTMLAGEDYPEAQNLIRKYKLEQNIKNLEWTAHGKLPQLLNSSLIYVDSFHRRLPGSSIGMTSVEAMACELPVVLANNPGVSEYIKHNYNGLIYNQKDFNGLAECIIKLLKNEKLRNRIGKNSRKTVIDKMNWNKSAKNMEKRYFELVEKNRR